MEFTLKEAPKHQGKALFSALTSGTSKVPLNSQAGPFVMDGSYYRNAETLETVP